MPRPGRCPIAIGSCCIILLRFFAVRMSRKHQGNGTCDLRILGDGTRRPGLCGTLAHNSSHPLACSGIYAAGMAARLRCTRQRGYRPNQPVGSHLRFTLRDALLTQALHCPGRRFANDLRPPLELPGAVGI